MPAVTSGDDDAPANAADDADTGEEPSLQEAFREAMRFHESHDEVPIAPRRQYAPLDASEKTRLQQCIERETKRVSKGDSSDTAVQQWKEEEERAENIRLRFDENMRLLETEIRELEMSSEQMKMLIEEDDEEGDAHEILYTSPEDRKKILDDVHSDPRYVELLDTLSQQRRRKTELEKSHDETEHLDDENKIKAQILELRKRIREVERDAHVFEAAEVANRTSRRLLELASDRIRNHPMKRHSLLQAHRREKRDFVKRLQSAAASLSEGRAKIKEGRQHAEELRSELRLAHKESLHAIADLCRSTERVSVPAVNSASYDASVAQILEKFGRIQSPPAFDEDWTPGCKMTGPIEPNVYQRIPAALANPDNGSNLLVYHDMGTGKTCTLVLLLLQLAIYYWNHPGDEGAAGCLVLVQNDNAIISYTSELFSKKKRCGYDILDHFRKETGVTMETTGDYEAGSDVAASESVNGKEGPPHKSKQSSGKATTPQMKWTFKNSDESPFFVVVFKRMSQKLTSPPTGWVEELPKRGAVIVDEAHNLEDPMNMKTRDKNHTSEYLRQLKDHGKNLKLIFLTGTPTTGRLWRLLKLLEILTKTKYPLLEEAQNLPLKEATQQERHLHDAFDAKLADEFFEKEGSKYVWKQPELDKFRKSLKGTVSYVTMANDPRVFARFAVSLNIPQAQQPGMASSRYLSPADCNGAVISETGTGRDFKAEFKVDFENTGTNYVLVKTRMQDSFKSRTKEKDANSHDVFLPYKNEKLVPAWNAVITLVSANAANTKHFFFYDFPSRVAIPTDFGNAFAEGLLRENPFMMRLMKKSGTIPTFRSVIKEIFPGKKITCTEPGLIEKFMARAAGPHGGIAVDITGRTDKDDPDSVENMDLFDCIYNHPANKEGSLIKYVFAGKGQKEGLSLFSTQYVHVLSPPASERSLQQAVRRALRYCGMKDLDKRNWFVTVLLYCADSGGKKCCQDRYCDNLKTWSIMPGVASHPVDLVLQALQENAVDCEILQPLTKVRCHGDALQGGKKFACASLWGLSSEQLGRDDPGCDENLRLPDASAMEEASPRDEQLRVLLNRDEALKRLAGTILKKPSVTTGFDLSPSKSAMDMYRDLMQDATLAEAVRRFLADRHKKLTEETQRSLAGETKKSLSAYEKLANAQRRVRAHHKSFLDRSEQDQAHRRRDAASDLREEATLKGLIKKR